MTARAPRNRAERRAAPKDAPQVPSSGVAGHPDYPMEHVLHGTAGDLKIRFTVPASLALRYELAQTSNQVRAFGAALGLCSLVVRKHVPYRHQSIGEYGLAVLDWLLSEGVTYADAFHAGNVAWLHAVHALISEAEVKEAEGFTAAPDTSTSS